jgi:hypothetical protein
MNSRRIVSTIIAALLLVAALWAMPAATSNAQSTATAQQTPAAPLSVSGKITSVEKDSFTLAVGGQTPGQQFSASETKSMTFMIDKNTTVEGKLKVNANADVTYREENGKNIAISVHVAS